MENRKQAVEQAKKNSLTTLTKGTVKTVEQALDTPSLTKLVKSSDVGLKSTVATLVTAIEDLQEFFTGAKTIETLDEKVALAEFIIDGFPSLRIGEIELAFRKAKKGEYGDIYNRLGNDTIIGFIKKFKDSIPYSVIQQHQQKKDRVESDKVNAELRRKYEERKAKEEHNKENNNLKESKDGE